MDNFRLTDEYRKTLLESAAWSKVGVTLSEATEVVEEEEVIEEAKKDKDEDKGKDKKKKKKDKDNGNGDDNGNGNGDDEDEDEKFVKEETAHVCPLCMSHLEEAIDEDSLIEHLDVVLGLVDRLSSLNEDEEDMDQVIDAALQDLLIGQSEAE